MIDYKRTTNQITNQTNQPTKPTSRKYMDNLSRSRLGAEPCVGGVGR
ncbi:hypothetical protein [Levilactobacillus lettrarii]